MRPTIVKYVNNQLITLYTIGGRNTSLFFHRRIENPNQKMAHFLTPFERIPVKKPGRPRQFERPVVRPPWAPVTRGYQLPPGDPRCSERLIWPGSLPLPASIRRSTPLEFPAIRYPRPQTSRTAASPGLPNHKKRTRNRHTVEASPLIGAATDTMLHAGGKWFFLIDLAQGRLRSGARWGLDRSSGDRRTRSQARRPNLPGGLQPRRLLANHGSASQRLGLDTRSACGLSGLGATRALPSRWRRCRMGPPLPG